LNSNSCYTVDAETRTGAFCFSNAIVSQFNCGQSIPCVLDLRPASSQQRWQVCRGRFAIMEKIYGLTYEQLYRDHIIESMRYIDMAAKYHLSYWRIYNAVKKLGVPCRGMGPRPILPETPVKCTKCGKTYPWSPEYFMPSKDSPNGCKQPCKTCNVARVHEWQTARAAIAKARGRLVCRGR